jgi:hypothetical protein
MKALYLNRIIIGAGLLIIVALPGITYAATRTWDAGGADTNWSTAANWSGDTIPGAGDTALFDGTGQSDAIIDAAFGGKISRLQTSAAFTGSVVLRRHLTLNENLLLSGGTLSMGGTGYFLYVKGSWVNDGATFLSGTGTVLLSGTGSIYSLKESSPFYNLTLNDGLVAYWKLDDGTGALLAADSSGNRYNGILSSPAPIWDVSAAPTNFQNKFSLSFDAVRTNEIVVWGPGGVGVDAFDPVMGLCGSGFTLSVWLRTSDASNAGGWWRRILNKEYFSGNNYAYELALNQGVPALIVARTAYTFPNATSLADGQWHQLSVAVLRRSFSSLYVDGSLIGTADLSASSNRCDAVYPLVIGEYRNGQGDFIGNMDEVRLYSRVLSAIEISRLAAGNQPLTSSGTYTLGSALDVNGSLTLAAGTLDVSSNNYAITASGGWLNYGGIFNARSGTVTMDGTSDVLQSGGNSFSTLAIASSNSTTLYDAATVTTALTIGAGSTLTLGSHTLTATNATITNSGLINQGTGVLSHLPLSLILADATYTAQASFTTGGSIYISLNEGDENTNGTTVQTVTVTLTTAGGDSETVTLTENGVATGIFRGSIPITETNDTPRTGNGILEVKVSTSTTVTASFTDADDGLTTTTVATLIGEHVASGDTSTSGGGGGGGRRGGPGRGGEETTVSRMDAETRRVAMDSSGNAIIPPRTVLHDEPELSDISSLIEARFRRTKDRLSNDDPIVVKNREGNIVILADVDISAWYAPFIRTVVDAGIAEGYRDTQDELLGEFRPPNPVTGAEVLKMALQAAHADLTTIEGSPRNQSAKGTWAAPFVRLAETAGFSLFTPSFNVHAPMTRGEVITTILEAAKLPLVPKPISSFADLPSNHPYARALSTAIMYGLIEGDTDTLGLPLHTVRPDDRMNRAEASKVISLMRGMVR